MIRVYESVANVIKTHEHAGDLREPVNEARQITTSDQGNERAVHRKVTSNFLHALNIGSLNGGMKTTPKRRPSNVTSFILEGRWPLAGFDQRELRRLSKAAKRNGVRVADVLYEAVESFVAKCEAEADLEEKVIKFPTGR